MKATVESQSLEDCNKQNILIHFSDETVRLHNTLNCLLSRNGVFAGIVKRSFFQSTF